MRDGFAGLFIPDYRGLALVGDADGGNVLRGDRELVHGRAGNFLGNFPDFVGIMLHPARLWENLTELLVGNGADVAGMVKQNAAGTRRPLVQCHNVLHSVFSSFLFRNEIDVL